jgi:hypothetical protein
MIFVHDKKVMRLARPEIGRLAPRQAITLLRSIFGSAIVPKVKCIGA